MDRKVFEIMLEREYEEFKAGILKKEKEEIFNEVGKIYFYNNVYDYLRDSGIELNEKMTLSNLWEAYLDMSVSVSVGTWEDVEAFIDHVKERI